MSIREAFLNALYPEGLCCIICGRNARLDGHGLCGDCRGLLKGCPQPPRPEYTDGAAAALEYDAAAAELIYAFKYYGARYLGRYLAGFMSLPEGWRDCLLIPVPLHRRRQRSRGYNQSLILAEELAARYGMEVNTGLLSRRRDTLSQTRLSAAERRENLRGAFRAADCRGINAVLVDDVLTTGSTMSECARALKAAGAARVYAAVVCSAAIGEEGL